MKHLTYAGLLVLCVLCLMASFAISGVPQTMNYQGRLTNSSGNVIDTSVTMTFTIYDDSTGGSPIWTETHDAVNVIAGLFQANLNSDTLTIDSCFICPGSKYLGIAIGGDPEIEPRTRLTSAPYAVTSMGVSGHIETAPNQLTIGDSSQLILHADVIGASLILTDNAFDTTVTINASDGTIHATGAIRSGNTLVINGPNDEILSPSGEMYIGRENPPATNTFDEDIKVGIGTTSPGARLEVYGATTASMPMLLLKHLPPSPTGILDNVFEIYNHYFGFRAFSISGAGIINQYDGSSVLANVLNPSGPTYFNSSAGGVGIGTASPSTNYALHVNGNHRGIYTVATQGTASVRPFGIVAGLNTTNSVNTGGGFNVNINKFNQAANVAYLMGGDITLTKGGAGGSLIGLRVWLNDETSADYGIQLQVDDPGYAIYSVDDGRVYIEGKTGVGTSAPTAKLDLNGANGYDQFRMRKSFTPSGSGDANGNVGDMAWDNNFIYIKTSSGWKRSPLTTF